jgi:hypothetical protein
MCTQFQPERLALINQNGENVVDGIFLENILRISPMFFFFLIIVKNLSELLKKKKN